MLFRPVPQRSFGETGEPVIDLVPSSKDEGTAKIQEELSRIYGLAGEEIRITVKERAASS